MTADLVATVAVTRVVDAIGRSLRETFYMFWETLWALVAGFTISGAVQAFVSRDAMQRRLGHHGPIAVVRASLYGMASSSCSYAASALARSLFVGGADFVTSMVFMFASTNLVVELGIVLVVLIGWQFAAAELVGGIIMSALLVGAGTLWFRGRALAEARASRPENGHHEGSARTDRPWWPRARSRAGWADAAGFTMSDLTMLRKEIAFGFVAAGFLTGLVPAPAWNDLFFHGHGVLTTLENVVVGPAVAIISFVCSIGNVALAAALWHGGISFGGVVSFVFADLITLPLLLIYRKQYGTRLAARMLAVFWLVMSIAGLITEELFRAAGWIPTHRPAVATSDVVRLDATTILNVLALTVFAVLYRLYRHRDRFGERAMTYATDPVCGMQVEVAHAPASRPHDGSRLYFCSEHCRDRFARDADHKVG
jgi:uncharacterized membrane protein YraQ (UPF0718 family)/YHS domain-containing protein